MTCQPLWCVASGVLYDVSTLMVSHTIGVDTSYVQHPTSHEDIRVVTLYTSHTIQGWHTTLQDITRIPKGTSYMQHTVGDVTHTTRKDVT